MVGHQRILTWNNLRSRKFHGPSICLNCRQSEETLQHLLNNCSLAHKIWDKACFRSQRDDRKENDIVHTLRQWPKHPYKSEILNYLWTLIPGMVLWNIWKERNNRIFKNKCAPIEIIWSRLHENLKETIQLKAWAIEDLPTADAEKNILNNWQLGLPQGSLKNRCSHNRTEDNSRWTPPPQNSFKLNFDGASRGNPGEAGFGGILRNHKGKPLQIYYGHMGWDTNNAAEMEGLWQGLMISKNLNMHPLIVEGDSQILINMAIRLQYGAQASKVASSWRLAARLNNIEQELRTNRVISFHHTKREGNKVADLLANIGVETKQILSTGLLNNIPNPLQSQECHNLIQKDATIPDSGDTTWGNGAPHDAHVPPHHS